MPLHASHTRFSVALRGCAQRAASRVALAALALAAAACAPFSAVQAPEPTAPTKPTAPPLPATAEPPAPKVNLSGFPLTYRQGYADGCASATGPERKDTVRFGADGNYRTGWQDGLALCRPK